MCLSAEPRGRTSTGQRLPREEGLQGALAGPLALGGRVSGSVRAFDEADVVNSAVRQHGLEPKGGLLCSPSVGEAAFRKCEKSDLQPVYAIAGTLPPKEPS